MELPGTFTLSVLQLIFKLTQKSAQKTCFKDPHCLITYSFDVEDFTTLGMALLGLSLLSDDPDQYVELLEDLCGVFLSQIVVRWKRFYFQALPPLSLGVCTRTPYLQYILLRSQDVISRMHCSRVAVVIFVAGV